jgi:hypothetical protein
MINQWVRFNVEDVAQMIGEVTGNLAHEFDNNEEQLFIGACMAWVTQNVGNREIPMKEFQEEIDMAYWLTVNK